MIMEEYKPNTVQMINEYLGKVNEKNGPDKFNIEFCFADFVDYAMERDKTFLDKPINTEFILAYGNSAAERMEREASMEAVRDKAANLFL